EEIVLTVADRVKVVHGVPRGDTPEAGEAIEDGFENELFFGNRVWASLFTNPDGVVIEVRVLPHPDAPEDTTPAKPELTRIVDHGNLSSILGVAFSPDGKRVVTATNRIG